jgi:hypothetical protein
LVFIGSSMRRGAGFRARSREAGEGDVAFLAERVADPQGAVIGDADDVAGLRELGEFTVAGEEGDRVLDRHRLAARPLASFMPRFSEPEQTRMKAMRSR